MKDNFNLKGYLRNNKLLNEGIGGYVDLMPLKEMNFDEMDAGEEGLFSITLDTATDLNDIESYADTNGISVNVINPEGPGGGWPEVEYTGSKEALEDFIDTFFRQDSDYTKTQIMPVDGSMNELNDLGNMEEDLEELEKPEKIYADDEEDSSEYTSFDRAFGLYGMQIMEIVNEMITQESYEPEDAVQFLRDIADKIEEGNLL